MDIKTSVVAILNDKNKIMGTGFVAGENLILTCAHVVEQATAGLNERVTIRFSDNSKTEATVEQLSFSPSYEKDVALLRVDSLPQGIPPLPLGNAAGSAGRDFYAYGYATVTDVQGIGARGKIVDIVDSGRLVQLTSQEPDHGMSGGPVWDEQRRVVIGMVTKGKGFVGEDKSIRNVFTTFATSVEVIRETCPELRLTEICPYRSLDAFKEEDSPFFFGRERVVNKLLESLKREPRFLAVLGPSGSGKSSVVQAGLIPALRQGKVPGSQKWDIVTIRPANDPFEQLAGAGFINPQMGLEISVKAWLADRSEKTRVVLVIDQFEEALISTPVDIRDEFITGLAKLLDAPIAVTVILTLRDDFYSLFLQDATELSDSLEHGLVNIPPTLEPEELRSIVIEPAKNAGLIFEDDLVNAIISDATEIENAKRIVRNTILPLLEFTLTQLWKTRQDGQVTMHSYNEIGKVTGGVSQWANEIYDELDKEQRKVAKQIVCELVNLGNKSIGVKDTRRVKKVQELIRHDAARQSVFNKLVAKRILVTKFFEETGKEEIVEIIHEVLIYQWGELRKWLDENRILLTWGQEMENRAQSKGRLSWGEIIQTWKFQANRENYLLLTSETARRFVDNNIKQSILSATLIFGMITLAIAIGFLVSDTSRRVVRARSIMDNAQLVYDSDPWLGQRLALEALAIAPPPLLDSNSYSTISGAAKALIKWQPLGNAIEKVIPISEQAFILDHSAVSGELHRTIDGSLIVTLAGTVDSVFGSSSGEYFVVTYSGAFPDELRRTTDGSLIIQLSSDINKVTFSNDFKASYFVTDVLDPNVPGELYRTADGALVTKLTASLSSDGVSFSSDPDARYVLVKYEGDVLSELRKTVDGSVVSLLDPIDKAYFSPDPDETYFVVSYPNSSLIEKRQMTDGKVIGTLGSFSGFSVTYSLDENKKYFVTNYEDGIPGKLRRKTDGTVLATFPSSANSVKIDQDPAMTYLAVSYNENIPPELRQIVDGTLAEFDGAPTNLTFDTDYDPKYAVIYPADDTSVKLLQLVDGKTLPITGSVKRVLLSSYLPDQYVVNYKDDSPGRLFNRKDGSAVAVFSGAVKSITGSSAPSSNYFAINYENLSSELRRKSDGQLVTKLTAEVEKLTFSPDSQNNYFIVSYLGKVPDELRYTGDGKLLAKLSNDIYKITFSGDAQASYFVTYDWSSGGSLYRTADGLLLAQLGQYGLDVIFSGNAEASYLEARAVDGVAPGKLYRTSDGTLIAQLEVDGYTAIFSKDAKASYFVVDGLDSKAPGALYRTSDGALVAKLTASPAYDGILFSSDPDASYVLVNYEGGMTPELRRTADGSVVDLSGTIDRVYFSLDSDEPYFVVGYKDSKLIEKRQISDGQIIGTLESFYGFNVSYSSDAKKTYYVTSPSEDAPSKLYRAADRALIARLSGKASSVKFSQDLEITYVAISYTGNVSGELRRTTDGSIVTLPHPVNQIYFNSNPAAPYFIVLYKDNFPPELRKIKDGEVITIGVRSITIDGNYDPQYAVIYTSDDTPTKLLCLADGKVISMNGPVETALFSTYLPGLLAVNYKDGSPSQLLNLSDGSAVTSFSGQIKLIIGLLDSKADYFAVTYEGIPSELRSKSDGRLVTTFPGSVKSITESSDIGWDYFSVNYESLPSELRRKSDGQLVAQLTADVEKITSSPHSQKRYFIVSYVGGKTNELRLANSGKLLAELGEDIYKVTFSGDSSASYFVTYTRGSVAPGKLYRTSDGALIAQLEIDGYTAFFSKNAKASYFVVDSLDSKAPGELYRTSDGAFVAKLTASPAYDGVSFSSDPDASYVLVNYEGGITPELRRTADGSMVSLSGTLEKIYFSPSPDVPYFVVSYKDSKLIEKRQMTDGQVIETVESFSGFKITYSLDANKTYYVTGYQGAPSELRRAEDNILIARLSGETSSVKFSQDPDVTYVAVSYDGNIPNELRQTSDGSIVRLPHQIDQIFFNSNPESPYFWVKYKNEEYTNLYDAQNGSQILFDHLVRKVTFCPDRLETCFLAAFHDEIPTELRRAKDNSIIAQFTDDIIYAAFSPDRNASYFVAGYRSGIPGELLRTTNGKLVTELSGPVKSVIFSDDAKYFVVTYLGNLSPELRRAADGRNMFTPTQPVENILISPRSEQPFFVVNYKDKTPSELFSTLQPNRIAELTDVASTVLFSPDKQTNFFVTTYANAPAELRRTADGSLVNLSGVIAQVFFSPDPETSYFVITYKDNVPPEQRRIADGTVIDTLAAFSGFDIKYSPDTSQSFFVLTTDDSAPSKLFLTKGKIPLVTLSGKAITSTVIFAPSQQPEYLLLNYKDAQSELWFIQDTPYRSIQLGSGFENAYFEDNRLFLKNKDGGAYMIYLDFLETLGKRIEDVATDLLMKTACQQPFFTNQDEQNLEKILGSKPTACQ